MVIFSSPFSSGRGVLLLLVVVVAVVTLLRRDDGAVVAALSLHPHQQPTQQPPQCHRRAFFQQSATTAIMAASAPAAALLLARPRAANAVTDCFQDCYKNCQIVAPKDTEYCNNNCRDYCDQPDRADGLSGSVSAEKGETGILGFYTVPKGEDKPPTIRVPGLEKLLGY
jgi:hypothetical protein